MGFVVSFPNILPCIQPKCIRRTRGQYVGNCNAPAIQTYLVSLIKPLNLLYFLLSVALFGKLMKISLLRAERFHKAGRFAVNIALSLWKQNECKF